MDSIVPYYYSAIYLEWKWTGRGEFGSEQLESMEDVTSLWNEGKYVEFHVNARDSEGADFLNLHTADVGCPVHLILRFSRWLCEVSSACPQVRWTLISNEPFRTRVRRLCASVAHHFGTGQAIYLPDSGPYPYYLVFSHFSEYTINEAVEWLDRECGSPCQDITTIVRRAEPGAGYRYEYDGGYYVDDFTDLK